MLGGGGVVCMCVCGGGLVWGWVGLCVCVCVCVCCRDRSRVCVENFISCMNSKHMTLDSIIFLLKLRVKAVVPRIKHQSLL